VIPGCGRRNIGHLDTSALQAHAARLGKPLHIRATTGPSGRLVWVLDVGVDMELTADYQGGAS